jgi:hypothetical protein
MFLRLTSEGDIRHLASASVSAISMVSASAEEIDLSRIVAAALESILVKADLEHLP